MESRYCPICKTVAAAFLPFGRRSRTNAQCPRCRSLERHRLVWLFFERCTSLFTAIPKTFLHWAPEPCLFAGLKTVSNLAYVSADIVPNRAIVTMSITHICYPSEYFDYVYCSHVLEHIGEDRLAMRETARVLKAGGSAIFMVPLRSSPTYENRSIVTPEGRAKAFGQHDRVRSYGPDFGGRLAETGLRVKCIRPDAIAGEKEMRAMALRSDEHIFVGHKFQRIRNKTAERERGYRDQH